MLICKVYDIFVYFISIYKYNIIIYECDVNLHMYHYIYKIDVSFMKLMSFLDYNFDLLFLI